MNLSAAWPVAPTKRSPASARPETLRTSRWLCPCCGKRFDWRWQLGDHIETSHPDVAVAA